MTTRRQRPDWVKEHLERYRRTDGADGHEWRGVRTLLLTTTGRRSGKQTTTPLIYGQDGDRYVVVASRGGADAHPEWYLNLREDPNVDVQVGAERFPAIARTANSDEKPELWAAMARIWPAYEDYQKRTEREIPVVILERLEADEGAEEALEEAPPLT